MPAALPAARSAVAAALLVAGLASAACTNTEPAVNREPNTGSAAASTVNGVQQITLTAGDDFRFHPATIVVHPGKVRLILKHTGTGAPHDWRLDGFPADSVPLTSAGQTKAVSFTAPSPGRYKFVCSIHVTQGMVGTLVVTRR
jgi:plastocyanin